MRNVISSIFGRLTRRCTNCVGYLFIVSEPPNPPSFACVLQHDLVDTAPLPAGLALDFTNREHWKGPSSQKEGAPFRFPVGFYLSVPINQQVEDPGALVSETLSDQLQPCALKFLHKGQLFTTLLFFHFHSTTALHVAVAFLYLPFLYP